MALRLMFGSPQRPTLAPAWPFHATLKHRCMANSAASPVWASGNLVGEPFVLRFRFYSIPLEFAVRAVVLAGLWDPGSGNGVGFPSVATVDRSDFNLYSVRQFGAHRL